jgi:tryptophan synthase beta subunit
VSTQPEALSLADYLDLPHVGQHRSAAELRRLHAVNAELLEALRLIAETEWVDAALDPQRAVRVARAAIAKAEEVKP